MNNGYQKYWDKKALKDSNNMLRFNGWSIRSQPELKPLTAIEKSIVRHKEKMEKIAIRKSNKTYDWPHSGRRDYYW